MVAFLNVHRYIEFSFYVFFFSALDAGLDSSMSFLRLQCHWGRWRWTHWSRGLNLPTIETTRRFWTDSQDFPIWDRWFFIKRQLVCLSKTHVLLCLFAWLKIALFQDPNSQLLAFRKLNLPTATPAGSNLDCAPRHSWQHRTCERPKTLVLTTHRLKKSVLRNGMITCKPENW